MRDLNDVVESGKVRYIIASSVSLMHHKIKSGDLQLAGGGMGILNASKHCRGKRVVQIYFHAELATCCTVKKVCVP